MTDGEELSLVKQMSDDTLEYLSRLPSEAQARLDEYLDSFDKSFPAWGDAFNRGRAEVIPFALLDAPVMLYAAGFSGSAIMEIYSVLEQISLRFLLRILFGDDELANYKIKNVEPTFRKMYLTDYSRLLFELDELSEESNSYANDLRLLRNAIAHKNADKVSNLLYSGRKLSLFDVDTVIGEELDCIPHLINATKYLLELSAGGFE